MMTFEEVSELVSVVEFRDWHFLLSMSVDRLFLRVSFPAPDSQTGETRYQAGRSWPLSVHMTRSEVVQTALKAVLTALEHEAREEFLYRGRAVYGPHHDVDALWEIAERTDVREDTRA